MVSSSFSIINDLLIFTSSGGNVSASTVCILRSGSRFSSLPLFADKTTVQRMIYVDVVPWLFFLDGLVSGICKLVYIAGSLTYEAISKANDLICGLISSGISSVVCLNAIRDGVIVNHLHVSVLELSPADLHPYVTL